jgi:hypothetical protein
MTGLLPRSPAPLWGLDRISPCFGLVRKPDVTPVSSNMLEKIQSYYKWNCRRGAGDTVPNRATDH